MDEELETLVVGVRADTQGFARDVQAMRAELDGPLADGLERAGNALERGLSGAIRRGQFGFEELRDVALSALAEIAAAAVQSGIGSLFGGGGRGSGGSGGGASLGAILGQLIGAPGRATGGPVSPGRAYRVGERGPEWFVPTSSGRVETGGPGAGPVVNLTVNIADRGGGAPQALQRSSRQVARAVKRALEG
ncbi:tail tape measure protein [Novosphingopyxis sp.]|uniref:tail tape measure protein n=1 Tax=Novosphingopyxis sp. TaxID=2709690 RepID=UPI003B59200A